MFNVGEVEILRVEESLGRGFQPNALLPDWNPADIEPHLSWLAPTYYDPAADRIVSSIHSWVLKTRHHTILIDTCVGNHKERPGQPRFHMLDRPYMENFARPASRLRTSTSCCARICTWTTSAGTRGWTTAAGSPPSPNAKYVFSKTDRDYFDPARGDGRQDRCARARVQRQRAADPGGQAGDAGGRHHGARRRPDDRAGAGALARPRADHAGSPRARRRCSPATSCTTRSRSIIRAGAAPSAPTQMRRAAHAGGCWSMLRARGACSIRATSPVPHIGRVAERAGGFAYVPGRE